MSLHYFVIPRGKKRISIPRLQHLLRGFIFLLKTTSKFLSKIMLNFHIIHEKKNLWKFQLNMPSSFRVKITI